MLKDLRAVRATAREISEAVAGVVQALRDGRVEQEPAFTDRMLQAIETKLDGKTIHGVHWRAKTLTDRGPNCEERQYGADFMGVLSISLPGFRVSKGFLAQSKLVRKGRIDSPSRLVKQCQRMLELSPTAFVYLYSCRGVRIASATSVVAAAGDTSRIYQQSPQGFFEDHLKCVIGDPSIVAPTAATLTSLESPRQSRTALVIEAVS